MNTASLPRSGPAAVAQSLAPFVALREKLIRAEPDAAAALGRTADVGRLNAELRGLRLSPTDALMIRVAPGRLVSGGRAGGASFDAQAAAARRRLTELEDELRAFRAGQAR